jgi:hypothetical protein
VGKGVGFRIGVIALFLIVLLPGSVQNSPQKFVVLNISGAALGDDPDTACDSIVEGRTCGSPMVACCDRIRVPPSISLLKHLMTDVVIVSIPRYVSIF